MAASSSKQTQQWRNHNKDKETLRHIFAIIILIVNFADDTRALINARMVNNYISSAMRR